MDDSKIIELYWNRNQEAIPATAEKYGSYCTSIARNILKNTEDTEECVNDTYLNAWNSMPPQRPDVLSAFLGKITRNLAFNKFKYNHADKRGGSEIALVLDELAECVSDTKNVEQAIDRHELIKEINAFLQLLPIKKRNIFICRYWYSDSISDIAKHYGMTNGSVTMTLKRLRKKLHTHLTERGFDL